MDCFVGFFFRAPLVFLCFFLERLLFFSGLIVNIIVIFSLESDLHIVVNYEARRILSRICLFMIETV